MLSFKNIFCTCCRHAQLPVVAKRISNEILYKFDFIQAIATNPSRDYSAFRQLYKSGVKEITVGESPEGISDDGPAFKVVDGRSPQIVPLLVATKSRSARYKKQLILLEGKRIIIDALNANIEPAMILFSRRRLIDDLPLKPHHITPRNTILRMIPYKQMKLWSDLTTSPGIFGIFKMPNLRKNAPRVEPLPVTLVLDNIREPGNLGSILRVAAAIPVEKVIILQGCTDLWDPKVIRGSSGAMFYLTIENLANWDDVEEQCRGQIFLADHVRSQESIQPEIFAEHCGQIIEDPEAVYEDDDDKDISEKATEDMRLAFDLPTIAYHEQIFSNNQSYVLIVGGETEGLSENAFRFAVSRNGSRINIPLTKCIQSLNAATALGIIVFEIKRQLMKTKR